MQATFLLRFPILFYYLLNIALNGRKSTHSNERMGYYLYKLLLTGGPFYIKLGQIMSTRSDLFSNDTIKYLQKLQDETPENDFTYIRSTIEETYKNKLESVFLDFSKRPIASASIAQVHVAKLHTGEKVAVKILRKNARKQMLRSLGFASFVVKILQYIVPVLRKFHASKKMEEIRRLLTEQLYFDLELHNMKQIRENFKNHEYVSVPKSYDEFCHDNIIVMEYIEGIKALDYRKVDLPPKVLAARLQNAIYTMCYFDGVCHGDPHPGNIIFSKDGIITFIDFGIVAYLTESEKWGLSSFYYAATSYQWSLAVERFTSNFAISDKDLLKNSKYKDSMVQVLRHHFQEVADKWRTAEFISDINNVLINFNASYTPAFTKAELAIMSCEGFASQMDPELDIWQNARGFSDQYSPFVSKEISEVLDDWYLKQNPKALALRDRAKTSLIASTHLDRYFFPSNYPVFVKKAKGAEIVDIDDNKLIDLSCGYGPHILGYSHPVVQQALQDASSLININALGHELEVEMAETLVSAFPSAELAVLSNSGTEAVIHALRLCRAYRTKSSKIAKFEGHYHGFSDQAMVSSWFRVHGEKHNPEPIAGCQGTPEAVVNGTRVLQFNHEYSLEVIRKEANDIAGVLVEPMQPGSSSIQQEYLLQLRELCSELDIPLVFDEVVSGFRTAYGGIQTITGIEPDITCLGKIIGGGLPAGAVVGKKEYLKLGRTTGDPFRDYEQRVFLGGTMSGNYLSCTTGLATLNYLKNNKQIYKSLISKTLYLSERLLEIARNKNINFQLKSGYSMFSMSFTHKQTKYFRDALQGANFKATLALAYFMRMKHIYMPELHGFFISDAHTLEHLDHIVQSFDTCLEEMSELNMFVK
ncbi:MAG: lipopolysaccharide core heptose(II) kinase RfaY [Candidatus Thiodiazotropha sp. 6PLUC7]